MEKNPEFIEKPKNISENFPKIRHVENFDQLENIRATGDSESVETGDCLLLEKNENLVAFSYGANPCISGVVQTEDNQLYMFHSLGSELTESQEEIIKKSKKGIVGGGKDTLKNYSSIFKQQNITVIYHPDEIHDFNIVLVKEKNPLHTLPGIYFCYETGF